MNHFPTLYNDVLNRIDAIDPVAYATSRNYLTGAVTYLSPYISRGVISLKQIQDSIFLKGYQKYQVERFIQELSWREYFQRVWQEKHVLIETDLKQSQPDVSHSQMPLAINNAATGVEAVDTCIKQLYQTGYMHNHVRMYTASIACNIGKAYWKQPAKWLYYHLLDGDIASNNCSWQWVAGAFSSKKYYCNQENINKYIGTNQRNTFLDREYEAFPLPDIPVNLLETIDLDLKAELPETSLPIIDVNKPTLIYNSYNLDPLWRQDEDVNRILLLEKSHFEKYPVSQKVMNFVLELSKNIKAIQVFTGEFKDLQILYAEKQQSSFIYKEHPAFAHYEGKRDERSWLFEEVKGFFPSFFKYWKNCMKTVAA